MKKKRKLELRSSTVRVLDQLEASLALGGSPTSVVVSCNTCGCDVGTGGPETSCPTR